MPLRWPQIARPLHGACSSSWPRLLCMACTHMHAGQHTLQTHSATRPTLSPYLHTPLAASYYRSILGMQLTAPLSAVACEVKACTHTSTAEGLPAPLAAAAWSVAL